MSQGPLCPNLTQKVQRKVSQMANRNFSCAMLLGGLSVNLNHLKTNRKSSTIRSYISAVKAVLRNGGIKLHLDDALLAEVTRACRLHNDTVATKLPITKSVLHLLINTLPKCFDSPQPYLVSLYSAMSVLHITGYSGLEN